MQLLQVVEDWDNLILIDFRTQLMMIDNEYIKDILEFNKKFKFIKSKIISS